MCVMQDNIVFGKTYEEQWYVRVVTAGALTDDLAMLPWGDLTEIGERGVNLSGLLLVTCRLLPQQGSTYVVAVHVLLVAV